MKPATSNEQSAATAAPATSNDAAQRPVIDSPWLTVDQGSLYANVSPKTLWRAIRAGQLRCARVSGRRAGRLLKEWIDAWLIASATPIEDKAKPREVRRAS